MNRAECFLENYFEVLRDEHKELILDYYSFLKKYWNVPKVISKFGNHLRTCSWSDDSTTSGPDTCPCYYFDSYTEKLNKIIDWYEKHM